MYSQYSGSVLDMFSLLGMLYGIYISYGRHFKQFKPQEYATVNWLLGNCLPQICVLVYLDTGWSVGA